MLAQGVGLDDLPVPVWIADPSGASIFRNAAWYAYTGAAPGTHLGFGWLDAVHPDEAGALFERWKQFMAAGSRAEAEVRFRRSDGVYRWFTVRADPVRDERGAIRCWIGIATDVDDLRRSIATMSSVTDALPHHVWMARPEGDVEWVNQRVLAYSGKTRGELAGWGMLELVHPDDRERVRRGWTDALAAPDGHFEERVRLRAHDGSYRWFFWQAVAVRDDTGSVRRWFGTSTDVDAQTRADESLHALADALPHLAWIARADGYTEFWNRRIRDYTGMDLSAAGLSWAAVVHPDDLDAARKPWFGRDPVDGAAELELRLRRADGTYRWFLARASAVLDDEGNVQRWFGSAVDIDDRKREENAIRVLADAGSILAATLDVGARLEQVMQRAVPDLADWCGVFVADDAGALRLGAVAGRSAERREKVLELHRRYGVRPGDPREVVLRTRRSQLIPRVEPVVRDAVAHDPSHRSAVEDIPITSIILVPLLARGRALGVLQLSNEAGSRALDERDLRYAEVFAERVAIALDNARLYARDRRVSETFQHAALPRALPEVAGVELRAVYASAEQGAEVGGDWYDAFALADERLAITIGDVSGRGLDAAVLMSGVRRTLRVALLQGLSPADVLAASDAALRSEHDDRLVTAFVGLLDPVASTFVYASAGHPAPLVRRGGGSVEMLAFEATPPLGCGIPPRQTGVLVLKPGDLLVLYTDGLLESTRDVIAGERRLRAALADPALAHAGNPARILCQAVLDGAAADDVALVSVRIGNPRRWSFVRDDAMAAHGARTAFMRHLARYATSDSDLEAAELIFGELVGNVVRYAPGPIDVGLEWLAPQPALHVVDTGPPFAMDTRPPQDALSEGGRGLFLCGLLGEDLSVTRTAHGNHVRITLPVRAKS